MLPRNRGITAILILLLIFPGMVMAGDNTPDRDSGKNIFIRFYQDHISAVDGARCPMTPSCSEYAARAIKKHGAVMGWIMACDRLVRCGRDEVSISPKIRINNRTYVSDPVSANDFWWFEKKEAPE
ncbi:MAG: membrane protein insertion efficiency factor YidD [Desulfobacterales bacterium]|nr:membrane protein insertion efficiency factor YidD [Desulfobacterales bacterium]